MLAPMSRERIVPLDIGRLVATPEILSYTYDYTKGFLQTQGADDDHISLIAPEVAGASGPEPQFRKFDTFNDEAHYIARCLRKWHQNGQRLNIIAVICGHHWQVETLQRALKTVGIPNAWLKSTADKKPTTPTPKA